MIKLKNFDEFHAEATMFSRLSRHRNIEVFEEKRVSMLLNTTVYSAVFNNNNTEKVSFLFSVIATNTNYSEIFEIIKFKKIHEPYVFFGVNPDKPIPNNLSINWICYPFENDAHFLNKSFIEISNSGLQKMIEWILIDLFEISNENHCIDSEILSEIQNNWVYIEYKKTNPTDRLIFSPAEKWEKDYLIRKIKVRLPKMTEQEIEKAIVRCINSLDSPLLISKVESNVINNLINGV